MSSHKIMVVEDEEILRLGTTLHLKSFGYEVVGNFSSGEEALEKLLDIKPDVVLMDIELAGNWNGITTAGKIKEKWDVPIIYVSVHADSKTIEHAKSTKPFRYMRKPFNDEELQFTIEMAVKTHKNQKKLLEKIKNYHEIISKIPGLLYRIDTEYNVFLLNDALEKISDYKTDEIKNNGYCFFYSLIVSDDREEILNYLNNNIHSKEPLKLNYRIKNKKGQLKNIREIINPVFENDDLICIEGLILDITGKN
ncbi:response regulator [Methanobacterium alcaliphilum]|uniref:response regulator n=1 Tax=Methanobacterium alcaliphilum TaxID=392018 RepID=UPI00200B00C9|nr:response regulator [Methanobacterium alcaliphilum]MCK9152549.1 response regulator [Methanobacterium alcaliphilum]